jgi:hypothetical protein
MRLLVSVRDADEARVAIAAGVEVIDVKEPSRGSLGRADDETLREIADAVQGRAILSFAAGEAIDRRDSGSIVSDASALARSGYALFKYGPAGLGRRDDWREVLSDAWRSTAPGASPIAVAYIDYEAATAPSPEAIVELAIESGCFGMLFDTFGKAPRLGLTALPYARLRSCIAKARDAGLLVSLAGSLGIDDVADARLLQADVVAVRGAVCTGDRASRIDANRIAALQEAIARDAASFVEFDAEANGTSSKDRA